MAKAKPERPETEPANEPASEEAAAKMLEESRSRRVQQCQAEVAAVLEKHGCELYALPRIQNGAIVADCFIQSK